MITKVQTNGNENLKIVYIFSVALPAISHVSILTKLSRTKE